MAGLNDDEILDFAAFARRTGRAVRFIEFMPLDAGGHWTRDRPGPGRPWWSRRSRRVGPSRPARTPGDPAPAERYRFVDGGGEIGVISSVTRPFCGLVQPAPPDRRRGRPQLPVLQRRVLGTRRAARRGIRRRRCPGDPRLPGRKLPGHGINDPVFIRPSPLHVHDRRVAGPRVLRTRRATTLRPRSSPCRRPSTEAAAKTLGTGAGGAAGAAGFDIVDTMVSPDGVEAVADAVGRLADGSRGWSSRPAARGSLLPT